jgi:hypothetical protein
MPKIEQPVAVHIALCDVKVRPYEGNQKGVEDPINKLQENLLSFVCVGLSQFLGCLLTRRSEPG